MDKQVEQKRLVRQPLFITGLTAVVLTASAVVGYRNLTTPRYAQVLEVREVSEARNAPRQRCDDDAAQRVDPASPGDAEQTQVQAPGDCTTVAAGAPQETAFDVRYRLAGKEDTVRLPYDPGKQIPVEDGKLILEPPAK